MKHIIVFKNDTITLSKEPNKNKFWLYDKTRGMNLSMRANSEQDAFIESLMYYQKRLKTIETELKTLKEKVNIFTEGVIGLTD